MMLCLRTILVHAYLGRCIGRETKATMGDTTAIFILPSYSVSASALRAAHQVYADVLTVRTIGSINTR